MLVLRAARSVRSALARRAGSIAPEIQLVTESTHEAQATAPGRAQVLRAPPGVDDADFSRALKALSAQHQPLIELPGAPRWLTLRLCRCQLTNCAHGLLRCTDALQQGIADWVTEGGGQSGRQLRHNSRRLLDHLRAHSRSSAAGGSAFAPQVRLGHLLRRVCALIFGVQELKDEGLTQLLRDARFKQEPAPRAVAAPSYSSREVRLRLRGLCRFHVDVLKRARRWQLMPRRVCHALTPRCAACLTRCAHVRCVESCALTLAWLWFSFRHGCPASAQGACLTLALGLARPCLPLLSRGLQRYERASVWSCRATC